jgi:RimJ/RimL family protein N-acetyltransferase
VHPVIAHTLANDNPSARVLRRVGFRFVAAVPDEKQGTVWRWELPVD